MHCRAGRGRWQLNLPRWRILIGQVGTLRAGQGPLQGWGLGPLVTHQSRAGHAQERAQTQRGGRQGLEGAAPEKGRQGGRGAGQQLPLEGGGRRLAGGPEVVFPDGGGGGQRAGAEHHQRLWQPWHGLAVALAW